jgi:hypothetical protein
MDTDIITTSEPPMKRAEMSAEPPPAEVAPSGIPIVQSLNLEDRPEERTKLRLYAILSGLYVKSPTHPYLQQTPLR